MNYNQASLDSRKNGSPLFTGIATKLTNQDELSTFYSPGIAEPCRAIAQNKEASKSLTIRKNTIAVVSDGSAVLGLGNIGPEAALPVMEGKCMLLKSFADVNAVPLVLNTQNKDEIISIIKNLAPTFGGINLEDISAPRCFEIEETLSNLLDIPVFHDDQDGTAMVTLAALKNSLKVVGKEKKDIKVAISGAGAAGIAIAKMINIWGVQNIVMVDSKGIVDCRRMDLPESKRNFCSLQAGGLEDALKNADVFIGVSKGGLVTTDMVKTMAKYPIIFALANPTPEIMPEDAKAAGARIVATGRSDYPNQINNVLIFPGFFKGLLENGIKKVNYDMKLRAAEALADLVENPNEDNVIPNPFDERVVPAISASVVE
ncbi:NAD-dependent malic enzyme [bacterium DOLZORAL124_38_8]|nr:MAG: NAD-dependent malic enzyme [bacterium DOLZORAL124_38_8]